METPASILPPLSSIVCKIKNLSILEIAELLPDLPLSNVYSFSVCLWKLSRSQASARPYLSVMRCQAATSLLFILLEPKVLVRSVFSV